MQPVLSLELNRAKGHALEAANASALDAVYASCLLQAQGTWVGIDVRPERFASYVAERLPGDADACVALGAMNTSCLYLACACADGQDRALALLEVYLADCDRALRRMSHDDAFGNEAKQRARVKMLLRDDKHPSGIEGYRGRGDLRSYVRVVVMREALTLRRARKDVCLEQAPEPMEDADPELLHLRRQYASEFGRAFADALAALASPERMLLRYHYIDKLNIDQIGALAGVHRVTASRRLNRARGSVVEGTRQRLAAQLQLGGSSLGSVLRLIQSGVEISLGRLLQSR